MRLQERSYARRVVEGGLPPTKIKTEQWTLVTAATRRRRQEKHEQLTSRRNQAPDRMPRGATLTRTTGRSSSDTPSAQNTYQFAL
ncbi:hypothetical protein MRX96_001281 [Rhipicephalus microplus]